MFFVGFARYCLFSVMSLKVAEVAPRWPRKGSQMAPRWPLGASGEPLGSLRGPLGGLLGASWGPLGGLWGLLGDLSGASLGFRGSSHNKGEDKLSYDSLNMRLGVVLGPSWGHLGANLEPTWGQLGALGRPSGAISGDVIPS